MKITGNIGVKLPKHLFYRTKSYGAHIYNIADTTTGKLAGNFALHETNDGVNILFAKIIPSAFESMAKFIQNLMNKNSKNELIEISTQSFNSVSKTTKRIEAVGLRNTQQKNLSFLKGEIDEFEEAIANHDKSNMEEEIGDILFDTVMLAESHGINPKTALDKSVAKLNNRMDLMEKISKKKNLAAPLSEPEAFNLWQLAKKQQRADKGT